MSKSWHLFPLLLLVVLPADLLGAVDGFGYRRLAGYVPVAISRDQAVEIARGQSGGRILSVETDVRDGRKVYLIRVLEGQQRVRRLRVDAETGRLLGSPRRAPSTR